MQFRYKDRRFRIETLMAPSGESSAANAMAVTPMLPELANSAKNKAVTSKLDLMEFGNVFCQAKATVINTATIMKVTPAHSPRLTKAWKGCLIPKN